MTQATSQDRIAAAHRFLVSSPAALQYDQAVDALSANCESQREFDMLYWRARVALYGAGLQAGFTVAELEAAEVLTQAGDDQDSGTERRAVSERAQMGVTA